MGINIDYQVQRKENLITSYNGLFKLWSHGSSICIGMSSYPNIASNNLIRVRCLFLLQVAKKIILKSNQGLYFNHRDIPFHHQGEPFLCDWWCVESDVSSYLCTGHFVSTIIFEALI